MLAGALKSPTVVRITRPLAQLTTRLEHFAETRDADGQLAPRRLAGAVHHEPQRILDQALAIAAGEPFAGLDGKPLRLHADSLCVHGDNAESLAVLRRLRAQLGAL